MRRNRDGIIQMLMAKLTKPLFASVAHRTEVEVFHCRHCQETYV
jgi:hypothetical protein